MKKLILIQPILPFYRLAFFNLLFSSLPSSVLYHSPSFSDFQNLDSTDTLSFQRKLLPPLLHFPFNLRWQPGLFQIPLDRDTVVCICGAPRDFSTLLFIFRCLFRSIPIIWWGHYRSSSSSSFGIYFRLLLMRMCSSVLFYTKKEVFRYYNSHPNFLVNKFVSGIDNGANLELADKYSIPYNFASRVPSILFIGRNSPKACFPLLLDALSLIDNVSFSLNIIGFDALSYSSALSSHNIIFHGPLINEEHIASIINSCFLFVYPGSVGLSLLHSMAYRLPSLIHSTRDHHMPEADAASTDTSFFFEEGNCASLANALLDAYSRPSCCTSKSAASYQTVNNSFNLNTMSANFLTHLSVFHDFDNL